MTVHARARPLRAATGRCGERCNRARRPGARDGRRPRRFGLRGGAIGLSFRERPTVGSVPGSVAVSAARRGTGGTAPRGRRLRTPTGAAGHRPPAGDGRQARTRASGQRDRVPSSTRHLDRPPTSMLGARSASTVQASCPVMQYSSQHWHLSSRHTCTGGGASCPGRSSSSSCSRGSTSAPTTRLT